MSSYTGRLAPTPTGHLHLGHASTFSMACRRAANANGKILLRIEDLDTHRCREDFACAAIEDLQWMGFQWFGKPVFQSQRRFDYLHAWQKLKSAGFIYPCSRSRREVASLAPHEEEPVFPVEWRTPAGEGDAYESPAGVNWRFRVPDGEVVSFYDENLGHIQKTSLRDFGDFVVWNRDDIPAYELAVVVDDISMGITEVVRGEDLLTSTARQILLYRALEATPPRWFHCRLVCDAEGRRLAKRTGGLSLRELREAGWTPQQILEKAEALRG